MPEYVTVKTRIASNHPLPAYGGVRLSERVLHQLADAVASGAIPMQRNHDVEQRFDARCLRAEVVDLPDGYKAVEADFEIDARQWDEWQSALDEIGAPGGMSFSATEPVADLRSTSSSATVELAIHGDAAFFTDDDLIEAGERLAAIGDVHVGRLLQFSYVPTCRIIIEYVHESGGLSAAGAGLAIGLNLIASTIFASVVHLLRRRKDVSGAEAQVPQVELHRTIQPDGLTVQTLKISAESEEVIAHALDRLIEPAEHPDWGVVVWDEAVGGWRRA